MILKYFCKTYKDTKINNWKLASLIDVHFAQITTCDAILNYKRLCLCVCVSLDWIGFLI